MREPRRYDVRARKLRVSEVREGSGSELDDGELVQCDPAGGRHGETTATGALAVVTDPGVDEAGVDVGYAIDERNLRAPDLAVGNVPCKPGWVSGVPPLAIEYADEGGDEAELEKRIGRLLKGGTRWVWVVRLTGPRRVQVHASGTPVRVHVEGELLEASGVLRNAVPVEALFDRRAGLEVALRNLLQRKGYDDLEAVLAAGHAAGLAEGLAEGRAEGLAALRRAVRDLCEVLGIEWTDARAAATEVMDVPALDALRAALKRDRRWPE